MHHALARGPIAALALGLPLAACGDDPPPLTDATSLTCPAPGDLPFRLGSSGFASSTNEGLAKDRPRDKGEASDTLGNPGGSSATIYLEGAGAPSTELVYRGRKARTMQTNGLFGTALAGERVSLWTYDEGAAAWASLGETMTDADGRYQAAAGTAIPPNGRPVYAMLEADGSCSEHYNQLLPRGAKVVITDIDGTLTTDDAELFTQLGDPDYVPKMKTAAPALIQAWANKGYPIIYMTARSHELRVETRAWLRDQGFPFGAVITANELGDADVYKSAWGVRMLDTFGWVPVAAYGNADTDITAYENAGIPKAITFVIGPLAGTGGTVAIPNDDYTAHIAAFVQPQPDNR